MDHLNIPEGCKSNARSVPYLNAAPKYDRQGFDGFPERHGISGDSLVSSMRRIEQPAIWVESFIQEWLWFGLMDEFAKACNISINLDDFITEGISGNDKLVTTASLFTIYARRVAVRKLDQWDISMGLDMGDLFRLPYESSQDATRQIIEFWSSKTSQIVLTAERMTKGLEMLSNIDNNTPDQDLGGVKIPLAILLERISSCRILMSKYLPIPEKPVPTGGRIQLSKIVTRVQEALGAIMMQHNSVRFDIILSIDILCHTIAKIIEVVLDERIPLKSAGFLENFEADMRARNWCPSRISSIANTGNTPLSYIASLLPSYQAAPHRCTPRKCLTRPAAVEAMTGKHRTTCDQNCPTVIIKESEIIDMWKTGSMPGIASHQVKTGYLEYVKVVDCDKQQFVAISHVWSHGLGNNRKNELPSCQVDFIFGLARELMGDEVVVWIDTLCVPIEEDAKRVAISKLRQVYKNASKVLVLDRDLMQVGPDPTEQILQLLSSEWQRRLWTLQEGRLAQDLVVRFSDSTVSVADLMVMPSLGYLGKSDQEIFDFSLILKEDLRSRFSIKDRDPLVFQNLVEDLASRSVTVRSDEPICLAALLGLNLEDFHPFPTMVDIYRSFSKIPQDLIFQKQPRLQIFGLTWAPSTFLETEFVIFHNRNASSALGTVTPQGIHIIKDCLLLGQDLRFERDPNSPPAIYKFKTVTSSNNGNSDQQQDQTFAIKSQDYLSPDESTIHTQLSRTISNPAIIWEQPIHKFRRACNAILVSMLYESDDGVCHCKFEMGLDGWSVTDENANFHQMMLTVSGKIVDVDLAATLVIGKTFCVG